MEAISEGQGCRFPCSHQEEEKEKQSALPRLSPSFRKGTGQPHCRTAQHGEAPLGGRALCSVSLVLFRLVEVGDFCQQEVADKIFRMQAFSGGPGWRKDMKMGRSGILERAMALVLDQRGPRKPGLVKHLRGCPEAGEFGMAPMEWRKERQGIV